MPLTLLYSNILFNTFNASSLPRLFQVALHRPCLTSQAPISSLSHSRRLRKFNFYREKRKKKRVLSVFDTSQTLRGHARAMWGPMLARPTWYYVLARLSPTRRLPDWELRHLISRDIRLNNAHMSPDSRTVELCEETLCTLSRRL